MLLSDGQKKLNDYKYENVNNEINYQIAKHFGDDISDEIYTIVSTIYPNSNDENDPIENIKYMTRVCLINLTVTLLKFSMIPAYQNHFFPQKKPFVTFRLNTVLPYFTRNLNIRWHTILLYLTVSYSFSPSFKQLNIDLYNLSNIYSFMKINCHLDII